jgi:hypothetical protein
MDRVAWCGTCAFDFECGFGNRCFTKAGSPPICVPECGETFDCPPASGCEDRGDGTYVCVSNAKTCCYGPDCDTCTCQEPKPLCLDINTCVECLGSNDCPPDKPICIPEKYECHIVCTAPTPARYIDPETGAETCVECTKSLDCPAGLLCGTFAGDPEKYHKCYQSQ